MSPQSCVNNVVSKNLATQNSVKDSLWEDFIIHSFIYVVFQINSLEDKNDDFNSIEYIIKVTDTARVSAWKINKIGYVFRYIKAYDG